MAGNNNGFPSSFPLKPPKKVGATGGGTDTVFYENAVVVTASYVLSSGKNASCVGPLTIKSGVTLTVPTGARLVVL